MLTKRLKEGTFKLQLNREFLEFEHSLIKKKQWPATVHEHAILCN